ncbi:MAG: hypothetical protein RIT04_6, partial [Candidatus Parcubacteria bacterium]
GPITNGGDWNLYPNVQHYHHQWFAVPRTLEPTNGLMLQTQYGSSYGAYPDWNQFGCKMPKTWLVFPYSTNGLAVSNRQQYVLRFKYNWTGTNASVFNLSSNVHSMVGSIAPFEHVTERSTNWTQFTCVIPTNVTTSWIYWTLGVDVQGAPRAQVDAVQFIPIPKPTEDDFALVQDGDNMIVQWNTLPFAYFHLEYASDLKGPWATNTVTPSVTNYVASVTFTNTGGNGKRFYRMHHNLHQN